MFTPSQDDSSIIVPASPPTERLRVGEFPGNIAQRLAASEGMSLVELPELLTPAQAAEYLDIEAESVRRLVREGRLRAVRLGNGRRPRLRIRRQALEALLVEAHSDNGSPAPPQPEEGDAAGPDPSEPIGRPGERALGLEAAA